MLSVNLRAPDIRLLRGAKSDIEMRGALDLVLLRVEEAEANKLFKKSPAPPAFRWADAMAAMEEVLGAGAITKPPYPEARWYASIATAIKENAMDAEFCRKLATRIKDGGMKLPVSLQFALQQHPRIFAGHFDGRSHTGAAAHKRAELPKLPEE